MPDLTPCSPLGLTVDPALVNSTVNARTVRLRGTVEAPPNSTITANGKRGAIDQNGVFFVDDLPLKPGLNSVELVLTTVDEQSKSVTFNLTSAGVAPFNFYAQTSPAASMASPLLFRYAILLIHL